MEMTIYHGSVQVVNKPVFGYGRDDNDYGRGFYCTEDPELAREWAAITDKGGFLNTYRLNTEGLKILRLLSPDFHILNWLAILLANRKIRYSSPIEKRGAEYILDNYLPNTKSADVIIGYRADDSYFSFSRAFLSNTITLEQLSYAMKYGDLGKQVVLMSKRAFDSITFWEAAPVNGLIYAPKRIKRDADARESYQKLLGKEQTEGIYLNEIIQKGISDEQLRIL
ncbi:DUF3990 domain-containing protein [Butyrivibrio sp. AD3002]|uniref:DUF3990 domain-containing protein n=1 Tax=Butyrivibrio sp. AD3002 TaxID=1280670 RepID=UPI0003B6264F|nr:DUF3990 domain-containing protein [Butyrivibrio sp. AD3002]